MELKTRYQYTYFIYPYVIEEKNYSKYLLRLLKDKKCTMKKFDIAKDLSIYQNFLPNIRKFMFWSFNYKFRDITSKADELKEFENIKIQTSIFKDSKDIIKFIKDITGNTSLAEDLNIDQERFITYSYACISQEDWNDNVEIKTIEKLFFKFFKLSISKLTSTMFFTTYLFMLFFSFLQLYLRKAALEKSKPYFSSKVLVNL